jgi:hypothetical protein
MQVFNVDNNNSTPTTITSVPGPGPGSDRNNNNNNVSDYLEWCKNNNPKHPDNCDCHWDEYQV